VCCRCGLCGAGPCRAGCRQFSGSWVLLWCGAAVVLMQPLLLEAALLVARESNSFRFSLFNHSGLQLPSFGGSGSSVGNVHDSTFVSLLPWLGALGVGTIGTVVRHMMGLGHAAWGTATEQVCFAYVFLVHCVFARTCGPRKVLVCSPGSGGGGIVYRCMQERLTQGFLALLDIAPLPHRTDCPAQTGPGARFISQGGISGHVLIAAALDGHEAISPPGGTQLTSWRRSPELLSA
jgi:hypothetical protein